MASNKHPSNSASDQDRQLAAILFADIVGYTALMQSSEQRSLSILEKFKQNLEQEIPAHKGKIIQFYGDGCLAIFTSSVDAARCAKSLQNIFQTEPKVPLRIGLHAGEVVFRENNIFGDAVNITSRVESLGVAGSVLLSQSVRDQIKNQEDLSVLPMGTYKFKNVEAEMPVYALKGEGLVIPVPGSASGKAQPIAKSAKKTNWWLPVSLLLIALLTFLAWNAQLLPFSNSPKELISEEDREKRLVIPDFSNGTNNTDLNAYGTLIADWLTKALMNKEEVNIISAQNIGPEIAKANLGVGPNQSFADATGVDIVILGNFYQLEGELIASADIIDIKKGQVLHQLQAQGPILQKTEILEALKEQLLSFWAVKDSKRFLEKPPRYEAYQAYQEGSKLFTSDPINAIAKFQESWSLDSTFFAPAFSLIGLYDRIQDLERFNEIIDYLGQRKDRFSKWEKLKYESYLLVIDGKFLEAAIIHDRLFQMDPSDQRSNFAAGAYYNIANYPNKAIEVLSGMDERYISEEGVTIGWRSAQEAFAHLRLDQHEPIVELARNYNYPKVFTIIAVMHIQALAQLDSIAALNDALQYYKENGIYSPTGIRDQIDHIYVILCNTLMITGKEELLRTYAQELQSWLDNNGVSDYPPIKLDLYNNMPLREKELEGHIAFYLGDLQEAITKWEMEEIPASNWGDRIEQASRLGVVYAMAGNTNQAEALLKEIQNTESDHPEFRAHQLYYQSRILGALARKDEAVATLRKALEDGFTQFRPTVFDWDPFLMSLFEYPPYTDLVKPKG